MYTSEQSDGIFTKGENDGDVRELTASLKVPSTELMRRHRRRVGAGTERPEQAQLSWHRHHSSGPACSYCS